MSADYYASKLDQVIKSGNIQTVAKSSIDWFKESTFRESGKLRGSLKNKTSLQSSLLIPGHMYFFGYSAKGKDDLPYWDAFPLVFPLEDQGQHFLGLNMHYLQPNLRAKLFDVLAKSVKGKIGNQVLNISYQTLKSASKYKLFQPCLKKYLKSHMTTRFIHVPSEAWQDAIFLPVADWKNSTHEHVWKNTRRG